MLKMCQKLYLCECHQINDIQHKKARSRWESREKSAILSIYLKSDLITSTTNQAELGKNNMVRKAKGMIEFMVKLNQPC